MILITSGAFISSEFQVELGKIPPSFLPLGNKRLYEHQVEALRKCFPELDIYMSVTDAYPLQIRDAIRLRDLNIKLIFVPNSLTLGESVLYTLNSISRYDESLKILHGDTYLDTFPLVEDTVSLADIEDEYSWEIETDNSNSEKLWCGFFAFSNIKLLIKSLSEQRGNFVNAIRSYQLEKPQIFTIVNNWQDLGHVNTYFRARGNFTTERSFNKINLNDGILRKTSTQTQKILCESAWFKNLPPKVKRHTPQLIQSGEASGQAYYELEFLPHLPLNELYVYGNLPLIFWRKVFKLSNELLSIFSTSYEISNEEEKIIDTDFYKLITQKTWARLNQYISTSKDDINLPTKINGEVQPSISEIITICQESIRSLPARYGILHGDLCFSNLLYDSRSNILKVIDPRGMSFDDKAEILGDLKYDIAKYIHSIIGLYDHIIAGCYYFDELGQLDFTLDFHIDDAILVIQNEFNTHVNFLGLSTSDVMPITILLFISMLPLHQDHPNRQRALLANAVRLYSLWRKK